MTRLLVLSAWRQIFRHPWQSTLTVLGVAIAVAVVCGIDLTHSSSIRAFELSVEGVAGKAGHEIVGGPQGLSQEVYAELRTSGLDVARRMAPVVEGRGRLSVDGQEPDLSIRILAIDPFAERGVRPLTRRVLPAAGSPRLGDFFLDPSAVVIGRPLAERLGLSIDDELLVRVGDRERRMRIRGILQPADALEREALTDLLICDLSTGQELLDRLGRLDRIDVVLRPVDGLGAAEGKAISEEEELVAALPAGTHFQPKAARSNALTEMTRAFRLNLHALSLLALLVGVFLVFNTMTFSVLQRRAVFGRLRALGVEKGQIFTMVLVEALLIGLLGTLIGTVLGIWLAQGLLQLVTQTINDLYFNLQVQRVTLSPVSIFKTLLLGLAGPVLASILPAREAASSSTTDVMRRSTVEQHISRLIPKWNRAGWILLIAAIVVLALPTRSVSVAFLGLFLFVSGFSAWIPAWIRFCARFVGARRSLPGGIFARHAVRDLERSLSRTGVAAAALVPALATTLGIGIMVHSFRASLEGWLETTLQADLYLSPSSLDGRGRGASLDPSVIDAVRRTPGIESVSTYRRVEVGSSRGTTQLHALDMERRAFDSFQFVSGDREDIWDRFHRGDGVLISEPYAYHHQLAKGDRVVLWAPDGDLDLEILGIFYDYASDRGLVFIHGRAYRELWKDSEVQSLGIYLAQDHATHRTTETVRALTESHDIRVSANADLRRVSLEIFDRTFRITGVLRLLAVGVAFFGLISAFMALVLEKGREIATLRALGATPRKIFHLVLTQTGLLGLLAGLPSIPLGWALSYLLIYVINKRSFGWTLDMAMPWRLPVETLILAMIAAGIAGLYPARLLSSRPPSAALREE